MGMHNSPSDFACHFGRVGRAVFAGETWHECNACLRESWDLLDSGITWNDALADIRRGWDEGLDNRHLILKDSLRLKSDESSSGFTDRHG
jgi:hypothetical protein